MSKIQIVCPKCKSEDAFRYVERDNRGEAYDDFYDECPDCGYNKCTPAYEMKRSRSDNYDDYSY